MGWTEQIAWEEVEAGVHRGSLDESWGQGRALYGGLLAAGLVRAMARQLPPERRLRSLLLSFVGPVRPGAVEARSAVLRAGRAVTQVEGRLLQDGKVRCVAQGAFGADRASALSVPALAPPQVAAPEARVAFPYLPGITPEFTRKFDYRWTTDHLPFSGGAEAIVQGWVRHRAGSAPDRLDVPAILGVLDAWPAPILCLADRPLPASTVTWQAQIMAEPAAHAGPGDWLLYEARSTAAGGGYSDFAASLWTAEGVLLAQSRQLVAEFSAGS